MATNRIAADGDKVVRLGVAFVSIAAAVLMTALSTPVSAAESVAAAGHKVVRDWRDFGHRHDHGDPASKKIIWFGGFKTPQDITVQDLQNASAAFDGFVVQYVRGNKDAPKSGDDLAWCAFTDRRYTLDPNSPSDYVGDSLQALENLPPTPMPDRFLRINAAPYWKHTAIDWTDDTFWNNVCNNMAVAGTICRQANLQGIFLDTEPYNSHAFSYTHIQADNMNHGLSNDDMTRLVEKRGRQVIQAINSTDPSLKIMVSFGYITVSQHGTRSANQAVLLPAFLDGMLDGSTQSTTFIDAFEAGYWHNDDPQFFSKWAHHIKDTTDYNVKFQKYPRKYESQYQAAIGLFFDRDHDTANNVYGWCGDGNPNVFYSPARLAYTVQQAAKSSDEYVWFFSEKPNFWLAPGSHNGMPTAYVHAIRDGQRHANDPGAGSLPQDTSTAPESSVCP